MGEILSDVVFLQHHGHVLRAETKAKEATSTLQDMAKKAKEVGIDMKARKVALTISKMDPIAAITFMNTVVLYAQHMRAPVADQLSLIDEMDKGRKKSDRDYYNEGFFASVTGGDRRECSHDSNSPQGRLWMQGWDAHQGILMNRIKPLDQAPPPAPSNVVAMGSGPRKRGRPSKAEAEAKAAAAAAAADPNPPKPEDDGDGDQGGDEGDGGAEEQVAQGGDTGESFEMPEEERAAQASRPQHDSPPEEEAEAPLPRGRRAGAVAAAGGRRPPAAPPPGQM